MLQKLLLDEFLLLAKTASRVAVFKEISADRLTPISIVEALGEKMRDGAILESGQQRTDTGRYSFITFDSIAQFRVQDKIVTQRIGQEMTTYHNITNPFVILRQLMTTLSCAGKTHMMDFIGGPVGFMSYDAVRLFEAIPDRHKTETQNTLPEIFFNFYRTTLMFDHQQHKLLISMIVEAGHNPQESYQKTMAEIDQLMAKITSFLTPTTKSPEIKKQKNPVETDIDDAEYMALVERAKAYIIRGDIFQVVLSRCFKQAHTVSPFNIYRVLRRVSPSPYMFYLPVDDTVIMGASPEKLLSVHQRQVVINPIAGSRKRPAKTSEITDDNITQDLLSDEKECAEHIMLVDLARNDLGAVCTPGTVQVSELMKVKHFSHISHITSTVTGKLRDDKDALDALAAAFPAGTLSGAPKIRAMQIIDALETSKRGLYGGAICRLDYQGNLDSCIAIRMAVLKDGTATVRAGGGIVYDSHPQTEADETRQKARAMLEAIALAEEEYA